MTLLAAFEQNKYCAPANPDQGMIRDFEISAKTSIVRKSPSLPLKILIEKNLLEKGATLNYGKGRYETDSKFISDALGINCANYDYVWCPCPDVLSNNYKNIYAGYVLNTLPQKSRDYVWQQLAFLASNGGQCFVAVRSDKKGIKGVPEEGGFRTSRGTYQVCYDLEMIKSEASKFFSNIEIIKANSSFILCKCTH